MLKRTQRTKSGTPTTIFRNRENCVANKLYIQTLLPAISLKEVATFSINLTIKVNFYYTLRKALFVISSILDSLPPRISMK